MPGQTVTVTFLGDGKQLNATLDEAAAKSDAVATEMGDKMDGASTRVGGIFQKLGNTLGNWGIPFSGAITKVGEKFDEADTKGQKFSQAMSTLGGVTLLAGAAGFAVIGKASIDAAESFQKSMEMIHTQAGASQAEVDKMSQAVLNLAGPVATAPDELAAGLYHLESAGLRGANALNALKYAAEGAKVGNANLEDVTNALGGVIASGIKGAGDYETTMGQLNAIVGAGDMRMQDLAEAMGTGIAASAHTAGLSLTDVGAVLATFGDNNLRGTKAAIYLRQAITAMVAPSTAAQGALKQLGIGSAQLGEDMRKKDGLLVALEDLKAHLDATGMDAPHQAAILSKALGGVKSSTGVEILIGEMDRLKSKYDAIDTGGKSFGKDYIATTHTLAFQMDSLKATVDALGVKFGEFLIPKLEEAGKVLASVIDFIQSHQAVAIALAVIIGGVLVGAIGAFTVSLFTAGGALEFVLGPIGLIIAAVALLVVAVVEIIKHWGAISKFFEKLWNDVKHYFLEAIDFLKSLFLNFTPEGLIISHWSQIVGFFENMWNTVTGLFSSAISAIVGFFGGLPGRIVGALGDIVTTIWNGFTTAAQWVYDNVIQPVLTFFVALPGRIVAGLGAIVTTIWQNLVGAAAWVYNNVIQPVINYYVLLPMRIVAALGNIVATIWQGLVSAASWVDQNVIQPVINLFTSMPGKIASALSNFISDIFADIGDVATWVDQHIVEPIVNAIKSIPSKIGQLGGSILSDITGGITGAASSVLGAVGLAVGGIVNKPTLAVVGEAGPEAVIPLNDTQRALQILGLPSGAAVSPGLGGVAPLVGPSTAAAGGSSQPITFNIDGQTFARVILPALQGQAALYQRTVPLPVFGNANA